MRFASPATCVSKISAQRSAIISVGRWVLAAGSTGITDAHDVAQWIRSEDVTGDGVTDYVYGELDRNVVSMTARGACAGAPSPEPERLGSALRRGPPGSQ